MFHARGSRAEGSWLGGGFEEAEAGAAALCGAHRNIYGVWII